MIGITLLLQEPLLAGIVVTLITICFLLLGTTPLWLLLLDKLPYFTRQGKPVMRVAFFILLFCIGFSISTSLFSLVQPSTQPDLDHNARPWLVVHIETGDWGAIWTAVAGVVLLLGLMFIVGFLLDIRHFTPSSALADVGWFDGCGNTYSAWLVQPTGHAFENHY